MNISNSATCCEIKTYLSQIVTTMKGRTVETTEVIVRLSDLFGIALLSLLHQDKKLCDDCSDFLEKEMGERFEIGSRTVDTSHDIDGNPINRKS